MPGIDEKRFEEHKSEILDRYMQQVGRALIVSGFTPSASPKTLGQMLAQLQEPVKPGVSVAAAGFFSQTPQTQLGVPQRRVQVSQALSESSESEQNKPNKPKGP